MPQNKSKPNKNKYNNKVKGKGFKPKVMREQPSKDSDGKRLNLDNARESKIVKRIEADSKLPNANDISDFNRNPELLKSAGSVPFASILGARYGADGQDVPGVMSIYWEPNLGYGEGNNAWNKAFQQIYSFIVHANSRNYTAEYTDYGIVCQAGMEVFCAIADAIRVYGTAKAYAERNFYYPDALMKAQGFDPSDIRENLGQMWFDINNLIMQTKQIWIPNIMPLLERYMRMNSKLYTDAEGTQSQVYLYVRRKYYMYSENASAEGGCLLPAIYQMRIASNETSGKWTIFDRVQTESTNVMPYRKEYTWAEFKSMIQNMINALILSQDRGMIYGNILSAYGADKIFAMREIDVSYTVMPEHNQEILMQIENATFNALIEVQGFAQTSAEISNRLFTAITTATVPDTFKFSTGNTQILNFHFPGQPSPESIMIATRLKVGSPRSILTNGITITDTTTKPAIDQKTGKYNAGSVTINGSGNIIAPITAGTEIAQFMFVDSINNAMGSSATVTSYQADAAKEAAFLSGNFAGINWLNIMAFDWHPFLYKIKPLSTVGNYVPMFSMSKAFGDFDNYIELDDTELEKLNQVAIYSVFGIPQL